METAIGKPMWFEIPCADFDKSKAFYAELLGWKFQIINNLYWLIEVNGEIIGSLRKADGIKQDGNYPTLYFKVDAISDASERVKNMGGELQGEVVTLSGDDGYIQVFKDLDKNILALWAKK